MIQHIILIGNELNPGHLLLTRFGIRDCKPYTECIRIFLNETQSV